MSGPDDTRPAPAEPGTVGTGEVIKVRRGLFGPTGSGDTSGYGRIVAPAALPGDAPRPYGG